MAEAKKELHIRLAELMGERALTQKALADMTGMSPTTVAKILKGGGANLPSGRHLELLARVHERGCWDVVILGRGITERTVQL